MLLLAGPFARPAQADDDRSVYREFVDGIGETVFFFAWPTAQYERVSFQGFRDASGGADVLFRVHGRSAFSDGPLWVDVVLELRNGEVRDLRFGNHNALLAAPGETMRALGEALQELTTQYQASAGGSSNGSGSGGGGDRHRRVVENQLARERSRLLAAGYFESHQPIHDSLPDDSVDRWSLSLTGGRSYLIVGYCDGDCSDLDLYLLNPSAVGLVSDTALDDYPKLSFRPSFTGTYTLKVTMAACSVNPCRYGVAVFAK
jgi:hypothetical protein